MSSQNLIVELSENFSLSIIDYCEEIRVKKHYSIADQLLRSGTSIGANVAEAQYAESRLDFKHKLKVANKEANETIYWLKLCELSDKLPTPNTKIQQDILAIRKILSSITRKLDQTNNKAQRS